MPKMNDESKSSLRTTSAEALPESAGRERIVESRELLGGQGEVLIRHEGRLYRLRRTRLGKLILTA
jgi:hemin uptake protein HemP